MITNVLGWLADTAIIGTYGLWAVRGKPAVWFHVANALGGLVLLGVEVMTGAWFVLPLTGAFTVIGWIGWLGGTD